MSSSPFFASARHDSAIGNDKNGSGQRDNGILGILSSDDEQSPEVRPDPNDALSLPTRRFRLTRWSDGSSGGGGARPPRKRPAEKEKRPTASTRTEVLFRRRLAEAQYEVEVDPFRGVGARTPEDARRSPWFRRCRSGDIHPSSNAEDQDDDGENNYYDEEVRGVVQVIAGSSCPSLLRWTQEAQKKAATRQKRKRIRAPSEETALVGLRPEDTSYSCECDFNPFCLATLGGVVNEALEERASALHQAKYSPPDKDADDDDSCVIESDKGQPLDQPSRSSRTKAKIESLRSWIWISKRPIEQYLEMLLRDVMSVSEVLESLVAFQKELIFFMPEDNLGVDQDVDFIPFAIPSGINNLGATCYLNTQLQCLAQNLVFTRGIFQWQPEAATNHHHDSMSNVMCLFQKLLAQMREGPQRTCCALEYTTALGLDHGEQQDPNEFSRLFFARMSESFQAQASSSSPQIRQEKDDRNNLANLFKRLFQGTIVYETTCSQCGNRTRREEEFEDINLPIDNPSARIRSLGKGLFETMFRLSSETDTDVQYCLDRYCDEERLEGDNQYLCGVCKEKQNATRTPIFKRLPPCLNIQLCRYIYDRTKGEKKKLTTKVLLPIELRVRSEDALESCYMLVAVMRHKGTTAYSGHYVAEAMDWVSGQWFLFNDEKVEHLENGLPSCSYDPENCGTEKLTGSNEAYMLYYVNKDFLAQSIAEYVRETQYQISLDSIAENRSILDRVRFDRREEFGILSDLCERDEKLFNTYKSRRAALQTLFREYSLSPLPNESSALVDSKVLMKFMSCSLDRQSADTMSFSSRKLLLTSTGACAHQMLHPLDVRRGKLVPKPFFDRLVAIMDSELLLRNELESGQASVNYPTSETILCRECAASYVTELSSKVDLLKKQKELLEDIDLFSKEPKKILQLADDENIFVLSKLFVKRFRAHVRQLMKTIGDPDLKQALLENESPAAKASDGVAALDMASLVFAAGSSLTDAEDENETSVNGSITCQHGHCNTDRRDALLYVPESTWEKVSTLFPDAKCHSIELSRFKSAENDIMCSNCREQLESERRAKLRLKDISKVYKKIEPSFNVLSSSDIGLSLTSLDGRYFIVHNSDYDAWKNLARREPKQDESIAVFVKRVLNSHSPGWMPPFQPEDEVDHERLAFISSVFVPLICERHGSPVHNALFSKSARALALTSLRPDLLFLPENDYQEFLLYVVATTFLLTTVENSNSDENSDRDANLDRHDAQQFIERLRLTGAIHPSLHLSGEEPGRHNNENVVVAPSCCRDDVCQKAYNDWMDCEMALFLSREEPSKHHESKAGDGSAREDPIVLDSDDDQAKGSAKSFKLRVFEASPGSRASETLTAVEQCMAWCDDELLIELNPLRRSARKRKTRYPVGPIIDENVVPISLESNVAALRLCLMERCINGSVFELNHSVTLIIRQQNSSQAVSLPMDVDPLQHLSDYSAEDPAVVVLTFDRSDSTLRDLWGTRIDPELLKSPSFNPSESIVAVRTSDIERTLQDYGREALMERLIDLSNATTASKGDTTSKGRKRSAEKGFTGTLLSSFSAPAVLAVSQHDQKPTDESPDETPGLSDHQERLPDIASERGRHGDEMDRTDNCTVFDISASQESTKTNDSDETLEGYSRVKVPTYKGAKRCHSESNQVSKLGLELARLLMENPDINNEALSYEAAMWVVREANPQGESDPHQLVDLAYAKYIDKHCK